MAVESSAPRRPPTRDRIVAAARELITARGVRGLRIADATDTAGVGRGSFYNHFGSLDELVEAVVSESLRTLATTTLAGIDAYEDPAVAASTADRRFVRTAYDDPEFARLLVHLGHSDSLFLTAIAPYARRVLDRGLVSGRFRVTDLDVALTVLCGGAVATIRTILEGSAPPDADRVHAELTLLQFGIAPSEAAAISRMPLEG
ncbi:MAG: TetR/AcrR family transcriptional regulator [Solirubrobacteraceae bacterium]